MPWGFSGPQGSSESRLRPPALNPPTAVTTSAILNSWASGGSHHTNEALWPNIAGPEPEAGALRAAQPGPGWIVKEREFRFLSTHFVPDTSFTSPHSDIPLLSLLRNRLFTGDKMRLRMAGRAIHGSTKAGLGPELGFPHLAIEITFSLCFSSLCPPPSPSSMATQVPILPLTFLGAMGLRANFLAFLRLTFFICKVADLVLTHDKYQGSSAWRAERMQRGPALIPPLPAIAAFFPALSPPAPVVTCPGPQ